MPLVLALLLAACDGQDPFADGRLVAEGPPCGTRTPRTLMACVDGKRYEDDLFFIEGVRTPASDHWLATQDLCAERLGELGFRVERHVYGTGTNVIGVLRGTAHDNEHVIISAHYDHVPGCAGADDNATGVAGALEAARVLSTARFERSLVIACWDEEEPNIVGSSAYAERALRRGEWIAANFVFEMIGFRTTTPRTQIVAEGFDLLFPDAVAHIERNEGRGDFVAIFADISSRQAAESIITHAREVGLPALPLIVPEAVKLDPLLEDLRRSDHAGFWERGQPGIMITDTGPFRNRGYHCLRDGVPDVSGVLDTEFTVGIVQATVGAAAEALLLE